MLKNLSIKNQLTIWYSLIILFNTVVIFFSFYFLTQKYFLYEIDRSLTIHAAQISSDLTSENSNLHNTETNHILEAGKTESPGIFIEIVDTNGLNSQNTRSPFADLSRDSITQKDAVYANQRLGNSDMRFISYPITLNNETIGSVVMGHPVEVYVNTLNQLKNIGLLLFFVITTPSIFIGYLLARSATKPISKLSTYINKVTSENLSTKIELPASSTETKDLINNFNSLLDRLNTSFNLERKFLGEMAHEIKTPLSVIKSNIEVTLNKNRDQNEYENSLIQIKEQIDKLSGRLIGLMDFAWSQSTDLDKSFKEVNLSNLMEELSNIASYMAKPKNVSITSSIKEEVLIMGKEDKLYQAFYNIIDNSVKYNKEGGSVDITLETNLNYAIVTIKDTGTGIEESQLKHIFDYFYRNNQNKNISGHGLGLAIAESIIRVHKGKVEVKSKPGKGSNFTVHLNTISSS